MEHINTITRDSLLAFIDWSITQDLKPDIFFHLVYQWFTKDRRLLSDTEAYIMSASFLLAKQQADAHKIPDAAALLWNDLILTTTKQKKFYTTITREDLFMRLDKLVHLLNSTTTSDTSPYQLLSNYSLSKNVTSFVGRETLLEKLHRCLSIETWKFYACRKIWQTASYILLATFWFPTSYNCPCPSLNRNRLLQLGKTGQSLPLVHSWIP